MPMTVEVESGFAKTSASVAEVAETQGEAQDCASLRLLVLVPEEELVLAQAQIDKSANAAMSRIGVLRS